MARRSRGGCVTRVTVSHPPQTPDSYLPTLGLSPQTTTTTAPLCFNHLASFKFNLGGSQPATALTPPPQPKIDVWYLGGAAARQEGIFLFKMRFQFGSIRRAFRRAPDLLGQQQLEMGRGVSFFRAIKWLCIL